MISNEKMMYKITHWNSTVTNELLFQRKIQNICVYGLIDNLDQSEHEEVVTEC